MNPAVSVHEFDATLALSPILRSRQCDDVKNLYGTDRFGWIQVLGMQLKRWYPCSSCEHVNGNGGYHRSGQAKLFPFRQSLPSLRGAPLE